MSGAGDNPSPKALAQDVSRLEDNLRTSQHDVSRAFISDLRNGTHDRELAQPALKDAHDALAQELHAINDLAKGNPDLLKAVYDETAAIDKQSNHLPSITIEDGQLIIKADSQKPKPVDYADFVRG